MFKSVINIKKITASLKNSQVINFEYKICLIRFTMKNKTYNIYNNNIYIYN